MTILKMKSNNELKIEIDKIQLQFKGSSKNFVKFLFNSYPPEDIPLNFEIIKASSDLKNNIITIIQIYHPNKSKMDPKNFAIHTEILKCLNRISDDLNKDDEYYSDLETEASNFKKV